MSPPVLVADQSAAGRSLEYDVKAAFLLNFTRFIQWPASESGADLPFTICILGEDPFGGALDQVVRGETVNGRKLTVQRNPATSIESCQLIYFGRYEKQKDILSSLHSGILSVGEGETFIREGGMIGFVLDNRRVRFLVNLRATQAAGLTVSSRLLAVAKAVEK